jgi:hypothetical protein
MKREVPEGTCRYCKSPIFAHYVWERDPGPIRVGPGRQSHRTQKGFACSGCGLHFVFVADVDASPETLERRAKKRAEQQEQLAGQLNYVLKRFNVSLTTEQAVAWLEYLASSTPVSRAADDAQLAAACSKSELIRNVDKMRRSDVKEIQDVQTVLDACVDLAKIFAEYGYDWKSADQNAGPRLVQRFFEIIEPDGVSQTPGITFSTSLIALQLLGLEHYD